MVEELKMSAPRFEQETLLFAALSLVGPEEIGTTVIWYFPPKVTNSWKVDGCPPVTLWMKRDMRGCYQC